MTTTYIVLKAKGEKLLKAKKPTVQECKDIITELMIELGKMYPSSDHENDVHKPPGQTEDEVGADTYQSGLEDEEGEEDDYSTNKRKRSDESDDDEDVSSEAFVMPDRHKKARTTEELAKPYIIAAEEWCKPTDRDIRPCNVPVNFKVGKKGFFAHAGYTTVDQVIEGFKNEKEHVNASNLQYDIYLVAYNDLAYQITTAKRDAVRMANVVLAHPVLVLVLLNKRTLSHNITDDVAEYLREYFSRHPNPTLNSYLPSFNKLINAYKLNKPKVGMKILEAWAEGKIPA